MTRTLLKNLFFLSLTSLILISCSQKEKQFTIKGKISDADTTMLYLERRTLTETIILDSVRLDKDGSFKFSQDRLDYPEFYLLKLNGQTINLSIDSTETITINAPKLTFALDYTIEGSTSSSKIKDILIAQNKLSNIFTESRSKFEKKEISQDKYITLVQNSVDEYKTKAKDLIYSDHRSPAAYFALFQKVDGYLIFDPYDKKDIAAFQAVATVWDTQYPTSPRASQLKDFTLAALAEVRKAANQEETINRLASSNITDHTTYYDITLPDIQNKKISLSSLKGKVVIIDFTAYQADFSPAHNILINRVYTKYKDKLEVYQVSLDTNKHSWMNGAVNLPWICVYEEQSLASNLMTKYNIQGIPTTFLVNQKGEIVKRILSTDDLAAEIQKLL